MLKVRLWWMPYFLSFSTVFSDTFNSLAPMQVQQTKRLLGHPLHAAFVFFLKLHYLVLYLFVDWGNSSMPVLRLARAQWLDRKTCPSRSRGWDGVTRWIPVLQSSIWMTSSRKVINSPAHRKCGLLSVSCLSTSSIGSSERSTHLLNHECNEWGFHKQCK